MKILITQTSAFAAVSLIKLINRIKNIDIIVYGSDFRPLYWNSANQMVSKFFLSPTLDDECNYIDFINKLYLDLMIDLVIPVMDDEIRVISKHRDEVKFKCILPNDEIINIFHDKYIASISVNKNGIPIPSIVYDLRNSSKVIFRDRVGIGSHGIYIADLRKDQYIENRFNNDVFIQEYIDGDEYTVDVLTDKVGNPKLIIPRKRITVINGLSYRSQIINEKRLIEICKIIYSKYCIPGLSNVQFIIRDRDIFFIELNTRFAATGIASAISSYNYIEDFLNHFVNNIPIKSLEENMNCVSWNTVVTRYYEETFSDPE